MLVIAIPFLSMRLGSSDAGSDPAGTHHPQGVRPAGQGLRPRLQRPAPARRAGRRRRPAGRVREGHRTRSPTPRASYGSPRRSRSQARDGGTGRRDRRRLPAGLAAGRLDEHPAARRSATGSSPRASAGTGVHVLIGGQTAIFADFSSVLSSKLPLFIGVVVLLSFLLLTAVFRSLRDPRDRRGHEPALRRRGVRRDHRRVPVRLARIPARDRQDRPDRGVRAGDDVRDPVRALDGLRGVPRHPHLRGMAPHRRQPPRRHPRPGRHRPHDHRRRRDHDPRLRLVHPRRPGDHRAVRPRPRQRRAARRADRPLGARPRA